MEIVNITSLNISGLKTRTSNVNEQSAETAKIAPLWNKVVEDCFPYMLVSGSVYAVYSNYESDVAGQYDLLVGSDKFASSLGNTESVEIQEGSYLKFSKDGDMPEACISLWQDIWSYFESDGCQHVRSYTTDFEKYTQTGVEIYISIK
jgi:predicted transcriptional regulator YdeE